MNTNNFSLVSLLQLVRKWRLPVLAVAVAAALISAGVSLLLPNQYKSVAVFYTTNPRSADPEWIFQGDEKIEVNMSTSTRDIDRLITIGETRELAEHIIRKFNLMQDYGIDPSDSAMAMQYALDEFWSNYSISHNSRDAIEVAFLHRDREKAAAVANGIVARIDEQNWLLTRENRRRVLALHEERFNQVAHDFSVIRDSLQRTRKQYNMFSQDRQSRELSAAVIDAQTRLQKAEGELEVLSKTLSPNDRRIIDLKAEISGQRAVLDALTSGTGTSPMDLTKLARSVDLVNELAVQHNEMVMHYAEAKIAYDDARISYNSRVSTLYSVQEAVPSMRKAKPVRWLIVVTSTLLSVFASLVLISMYEVYRSENQKSLA